MTITNFYDHSKALDEIANWLKRGVFNQESLHEIEEVIEAVECYMGMPLPAKSFIESNCAA